MSPRMIGFLRGLGEAVLSAVLLAAAAYLEVADLPAEVAVYVPVLVLALRTAEAELLDQRKDDSGA